MALVTGKVASRTDDFESSPAGVDAPCSPSFNVLRPWLPGCEDIVDATQAEYVPAEFLDDGLRFWGLSATLNTPGLAALATLG